MPIFDIHSYLATLPFTDNMADRQHILESMARFGIGRVGLLSHLAVSCDMVEGNRLLSTVTSVDDGVLGYVTLKSEFPEESLQEQRAYLSRHDFIGAAIFPPPNKPVTFEDAQDLINAHRRFAKPLLISTPNGDAVHAVRKIASEFPQMKIILLGMGGEDWRAAVEAAKKHVNLYLDISGSLDSDKIAHTAAALTSRRLLFGSGSPFCDPNLFVGFVEDSPTLTSADKQRIFARNAVATFASDVSAD